MKHFDVIGYFVMYSDYVDDIYFCKVIIGYYSIGLVGLAYCKDIFVYSIPMEERLIFCVLSFNNV